MKKQVSAYVYAWVSDGKWDGRFEVSQYRMTSENWVPVFTDEKGQAVTATIEIEVPDNWDWRGQAIKTVEEVIKQTRAEATVKIGELEQQRDKLLAIEFTPSREEHPDDDIPF
jgi:hypothetical protein